MFEVGDKVEVIASDDPLFGGTGVVAETFYASNYRQVGVVVDGAYPGRNVILWFGKEELRKVDA
jgi:hypothetical protein